MLCWRLGRGSSRMLGAMYWGERDPEMHGEHVPCGWVAATAEGRRKRGFKGIGIELRRCCGREREERVCVCAGTREGNGEVDRRGRVCARPAACAGVLCGARHPREPAAGGLFRRLAVQVGTSVASQLMQASGWPATTAAPCPPSKVVVV